MLLVRVVSDIEKRQNDDREARRRGFFRRWGRRGLRLGGPADLQRIDPDWLGDVLEFGRAEVGDRQIEPALYLPVGLLGETDRARRGDPLQPRRDIDAISHQIAVALLDDVAEMNADAKLDATLRRQAGVAFDETVLHLDRAAHGVDHAAELNKRAVAGALDDAPVVRVDRGIDQIAAQPAEPRQRAILVGAGEPAVTDDVRDQDRRDFPHSRHGAPSRARLAQMPTGRRGPMAPKPPGMPRRLPEWRRGAFQPTFRKLLHLSLAPRRSHVLTKVLHQTERKKRS